MCPKCLSLARHRLLAYYLARETEFYAAHMRVLHVAPERCLARRFARLANLDYVTGDLNRRDVACQLDVTALPFEDESFDAVLCLHVLEHVADDFGALTEIRRVLRPEGLAIVQPALNPAFEHTDEDVTLTDPFERFLRFETAEHLRIYGRDFEARLQTAGFSVTARQVSGWLSRTAIGLYGFDRDEIFHVCVKPS